MAMIACWVNSDGLPVRRDGDIDQTRSVKSHSAAKYQNDIITTIDRPRESVHIF